MAAPSYTARGTPSGLKLKEGHSFKLTFKSNPTLCLWEVEVEPPGANVAVIEQTTQHNTAWHTKAFSVLKELENASIDFAYNPKLMSDLQALMGVNDEITLHCPDGSRFAFWGGLQSIKFAKAQKGQQPRGSAVIVPTMVDNSDAEQAPAYSDVVGT